MTKTTKRLLGSIVATLGLATAADGIAATAREVSGQGTTTNLADLQQGETRTIGDGAKQVTVSRHGDIATIQRPARDGERALSITCQLANDRCRIVTLDSDPEKVAIFVEKTRTCVDGEGDCDPVEGVELEGLGSGTRVMVDKIADCDGPGDCVEDVDVVHGAGEGGVMVLRLHGNGVLLRCPKGDTTMRVDSADADRTYFCPKHAMPLERARSPRRGSAAERNEAQ